MDDETAAALLQAEKARVLDLLRDTSDAAQINRDSLDDQGDWDDPAVSLISEEADDAIAASLRERLAAIERAEQRLREGTYGRSRSKWRGHPRRTSRGRPCGRPHR